MNWKRALLGGLLAEILVLVLIVPIAFVVYQDRVPDLDNIPASVGYSIVVASFIAPLLLTQWVAKRVTSAFVLHGVLVGFTAFAVYMIPIALYGERQPVIYWIAHAAKILGGLTGGLVAARRHYWGRAKASPLHV